MKPPRVLFVLMTLLNGGLAMLGGRWAWLNVFAAGLFVGMLIVMEGVAYQDRRS